MKINYGCGRRVESGLYNIDAQHHPKAPRAPDLIFEMRFNPDGSLIEPTPLADGCAEMLQAMHVIEHVFRWQAPYVLREWRRLLEPGGLLVLELPHAGLAARNLIEGEPAQMAEWAFWGDPGPRDPYNCHKWGYTPATLKRLLTEAEFWGIRFAPPQTHGARANRDMRCEARKA